MLREFVCILTALIFMTPAFSLHADDPAGPQYTNHARVMVVRDEQNREQPVKTKDDWQRRRKHILAGMEQAMGPLPVRTPVPFEEQVSVDLLDEGFRKLALSFTTNKEDGDRITAYLYLPENRPANEKRPAMLALHPTGPLGKGIVDGQGMRANRGYARELAKRGYVVLAPDYPSFGDLSAYNFAADRYVSGTMKGIVNHMRCVDYLQSRAEVDPNRIGVIGHSLGGHNAMFVGVFDERLKVIVSSCGWCPFHDYYGGKIAGWTSDRYMPRLRDEYGLDPNKVPFDFYEIVAALAPRAFFSVSPLRDSNFDVNGVKKAIPVAMPVYELLGAGDNLQVRYPDSEHDFPDESRREAYEFIDRVLAHSAK